MKSWQKIVSFIASFSLLINSVATPLVVLAQEAEPTPTPIVENQTPEPTPTVESTQTPEATIEPTIEPTTESTSTSEETSSPTPTENSDPEPTTESENTDNNNSESSQESTPAATENSSPSPTPTITPVIEEDLEGTVEAQVIQTDLFSSALGENSWFKVVTDKLDYAPTEAAVITGSGFETNKTYSLTVSSSDDPATSTTVDITTDTNGSFSYTYQLDGNYRLNYLVEVKDGEVVIAMTAFTDSLLCTSDVNGANDQPGQKDLTKMCYDKIPATKILKFDWDEIVGGGNNTYDGCSLWDTDSDGKANYSLCVNVLANSSTDVMEFNSFTLYSCGDGKTDRCSQQVNTISAPGTTCSTSQANDDPFSTGAAYPQDTVATCNINPANFGNSPATLLNVCSFPSGQPNSDPSDCVAEPTGGFITVVKVATPNDNTTFPFTIAGTSNYSFSINGSNSSQRYSVENGTYSVTEDVPNGWALTTASCVDTNTSAIFGSKVGNAITEIEIDSGDDLTCTFNDVLQNGTLTVQKTTYPSPDNTMFDIVATGTGTITDGGIGQISNDTDKIYTVTAGTYSVTETLPTGWTEISNTCTNVGVTAGQNATCLITNGKLPKLTVTKIVTNDNGGTKQVSDFPLFVNGDSVTSGVQNTFNPNSYVVSETGATGYTASFSAGDCDENGNVTLSYGDVKSCTITNNDVPGTLIVVKELINDDGGTLEKDDFNFKVNGGSNVSFEADGQNDLTVNAGNYSVVENSASGYSTGYDNCTDVEVTNGGTTTCTVTNNDNAPTLKLIKVVTANNGGNEVADDWTLSATSTNITDRDFNNLGGSGSFETVYANNEYTLGEVGPSGYTASAWDCNGGTLIGDKITLGLGEDVTCSITNNDTAPTITLTKVVNNNWGGSLDSDDFTLTLDGLEVVQGAATEVDANEAYAINEDPEDGYEFVSITGDPLCPLVLGGSVTLNEGQNISCTITNQDLPATLIVKKHVINDNGGLLGASDFTMNVTGTNVSDASFVGDEDGTTITLNSGNYSVDEDNVSTYSKTLGTDCSGTIVNGETKTCVITNDDISPTLTVVKTVVPESDNGLFDLLIDGQTKAEDIGDNGTTGAIDVNVGDHTVSEVAGESTDLSEYVAVIGGDCDSDGNVTLALAENKTCTITNTKNGHLIVQKTTVPSGDEEVFGITATGSGTITGGGLGTVTDGLDKDYEVTPGLYSVTENTPGNWIETSNNCDDIEVSAGETEYCQIVNTKKGNVTVTKYHDHNGNGIMDQDDETLNGWWIHLGDWDQATQGDGQVTFSDINPDVYGLSETIEEGWGQSNIACSDTDQIDNDNDFSVTVNPGETTFCSIGNFVLSSIGDFIWRDDNGDGVQDPGEPGIEGVTANLYKDDGDGIPELGTEDVFIGTDTTGVAGVYLFEDLVFGDYWVDVVDATVPAGYFTTTPDPSFVDDLDPGEVYELADFGYVPPQPEISIVKDNNKPNASAGDTVEYTLNITNGGNVTITGVDVIDILPGGFTYVLGSTTGATTSDPIITGSKLTWENVDDLAQGESFNLTYQVKLASDLTFGTYTNFATCKGDVARLQSEENCNTDNSNVTLGGSPSFGGNITPQVLGASTELPATGNPTTLLIFGLGALVGGLVLKKKYENK